MVSKLAQVFLFLSRKSPLLAVFVNAICGFVNEGAYVSDWLLTKQKNLCASLSPSSLSCDKKMMLNQDMTQSQAV